MRREKRERKVASEKKTSKPQIFSKYEYVRIISARAQQIAAGAPLLLREEEIPPGLDDPVELAKLEFEKGRLPVIIERDTRIKGKKE